MFEQSPKEEFLSIIKEIEADSSATQRILSAKIGISLGKTNYLLKKLIQKGLIKAKSFSSKPYKIKKINYMLTRRGIREKMLLTGHFLKIKEAEYNLLKGEWERLENNKA